MLVGLLPWKSALGLDLQWGSAGLDGSLPWINRLLPWKPTTQLGSLVGSHPFINGLLPWKPLVEVGSLQLGAGGFNQLLAAGCQAAGTGLGTGTVALFVTGSVTAPLETVASSFMACLTVGQAA